MEKIVDEEVEQLKQRVAYLERELGESLHQNRFKQKVNSLPPSSSDADIDVSEGPYGYHARITNIDGDDVQYMIEKVDGLDKYDYAVTETGTGLGFEVWTESFK